MGSTRSTKRQRRAPPSDCLQELKSVVAEDGVYSYDSSKILTATAKIFELLNAPVSEDDPAMLFDWNTDALEIFVARANAGLQMAPPQPGWITSAAGNMTVSSFTANVITYLAVHGGGAWGRIMIAPNNLVQYANIQRVVTRDIELSAFVQFMMQPTAADDLLPPLATLAHVTDRSSPARPIPDAVVPPQAPDHPVFA